MATKDMPGKPDCYERALHDEPYFTLLARDPDFARLVNKWADRREADVKCGERPTADMEAVADARKTAQEGADWRKRAGFKWRKAGAR